MLICLVTDRRLRPDLHIEALIDAAVRSGADMVQIREKDLDGAALVQLARRAVSAGGAEVFVNGRADVALCAGASGVHLPSDGVPVAEVRSVWGGRIKVGASTHSLREARAAEAAGADYVIFGPIFETPSKRAHGPPPGIPALEAVLAAMSVPVLAIGGINRSNLRRLAGLPLAGVAMISAILTARDMREAVSELRLEARR